ncbi:elongation factor 1-beta [Patella vulgata]|uniref:elongation factor 1-beta n=1 Tax=Patella vulgata TaxID=6465 RepID=UPI0024A85316|nr:elongation factor 1-beta [Patella vulgata]
MGFGDLKSKAGLEALNSFLGDRSYIDGYSPSAADAVVFEALTGAPASSLPHALRWYNHIKSYGDLRKSFPGTRKPVGSYGTASAAAAADDDDDDDDIDLFGDDDDDTAAQEELKKKRIEDYANRKAKKPVLIAKSSIILEVKPWDDETDMKIIEQNVRSIEADGLRWAASKLVPVGYGINKLQINCVVEDDKIGTDFLEEEITKFEDVVQSVDIVAFNKI